MSFSLSISNPIKPDSTVSITSDQLKYANLIFVEHNKLFKENKLLNQQINNYQLKTDYLLKTDSLRVQQLNEYQLIHDQQMKDFNKELKKKDRIILGWQIGGITISCALLLFVILNVR